MCINAAKGIHLQCSREYWDNQLSSSDERATSIVKLSLTERQNLATGNLVCECYLATFGYIASNSASHLNKRFKAKRIRDDLMFKKKDTLTVSISNNAFQEVFQVLDEMEDTWTEDQKKAQKDRLKAAMEKGRREGEFHGIVLRKCKLHDGPLTSVNELQTFLKTQKENKGKKKLLRLEIQYQRLSYQRECQD